jgi:16S rRNA (cytidine1402-2'-O)-methyltransferase
VRRGPLGELVEWARSGVKGEITVVVAGFVGSGEGVSSDPARLAELVADAEATGMARKEAIAEVVRSTGAGRREVFDALVAHKHR